MNNYLRIVWKQSSFLVYLSLFCILQIEEAREVLHRIRNEGVEEELQEIQDAVQQASQLFGFRTALKK